MAHAYETFAAHGRRIGGTLGTAEDGPVGIHEIKRVTGSDHSPKPYKKNRLVAKRVLSPKLADLETQLLTGPVKFGTATRAQYGGFAAGKTGTTENSGDAWFVGFTDRWTIAVWVGYPTTLKPMLTEFRGTPVTGGTFPAMIWHDFVMAANKIVDDRNNKDRAKKGLPPLTPTSSTPSTTATVPSTTGPVPREGAAPAGQGTTGGSTGGTPPQYQPPAATTPATPAPTPTPTPTTPQTPTPAPSPTPTPTPAPTPPAGGDGGTGTTGGTGAG
jgi:penicillin-binding protein 1A